jgi:hypothetical protein
VLHRSNTPLLFLQRQGQQKEQEAAGLKIRFKRFWIVMAKVSVKKWGYVLVLMQDIAE